MPGNGPVRFGGRPRGKGPALRAPRRAADPTPEKWTADPDRCAQAGISAGEGLGYA